MFVKALNDHLIFPVKDPRAAKFFPGARAVQDKQGRHLCAVPHSLEASRLLVNKGIDAPSPIRFKYNWPGPFTPYPHQLHTAEFLTLNKRSFCLNGMGAMKTSSSIWAMDYLMKEKDITRCLIISPLSTLERVWGDELFRIIPRRSVAMLHGTREKRLELLKQKHDIYVINHDGLAIIADALAERPDIDHIILDEQTCIRNANTRRFKIFNMVFNKQHPRSCWGLTGTPTPRAPTDAYGQAKLIKPENYRGGFRSFQLDTMYQINQFKWVPKRGAEQVVAQVLSPSIRYALEDCISLPPTIRQERQCSLSKEQEKHYKELMDEAVTTIGDSQITAVNAAVLVNKLVQASCGVMYDANKEVVRIDFGPRLGLLKEIIEECNEKIIVFVPLTGCLKAVAAELAKDYSVEMIYGDVSKGKRNNIFTAFQHSKDPRILVADAGTMAHGLNLTAATTIIWYAPINSNDIYTQANARIVRPGQKNVTNIVHMHATNSEAKIYKALAEQTRIQDTVLELVKERC